MNTRVALPAGLFAVLMMTAACSENLDPVPTAPTGPASLSSFLLPRVDGLWGGPLTLASVAGGTGPARDAGGLECAGAAFDAVVGESIDHTLSITRTGTDVTAITARLTSTGTGLACTYAGRIGSNGTLVLDAESCAAPVLLLRCPPNEAGVVLVREMQLVGSSITASIDAPVNVTSVSGTAAHTYNVTGNEGNVGTLIANHIFTNLTRR